MRVQPALARITYPKGGVRISGRVGVTHCYATYEPEG